MNEDNELNSNKNSSQLDDTNQQDDQKNQKSNDTDSQDSIRITQEEKERMQEGLGLRVVSNPEQSEFTPEDFDAEDKSSPLPLDNSSNSLEQEEHSDESESEQDEEESQQGPNSQEQTFKQGELISLVRVRFPGNAKSFPFLVGQRKLQYGQKVVALSDRGNS